MFNANAPHSVHSPLMYQSWTNISFLHWVYDAKSLQATLPAGLNIKLFNDSAWITLSPFLLENLRAPFVPSLPWLSRFPETNLRTYVNGPAGPGIWFFSLDADRLAAVIGARASFGLPYHWSDMRVKREANRMDYYSSRGGRARARIQIEIGASMENPDELATFLVARFRLYSLHRGQLSFAEVEHKPWPLHEAEVVKLEQNVTDASGLHVSNQPSLVYFSPGVNVRVGPLRKCG